MLQQIGQNKYEEKLIAKAFNTLYKYGKRRVELQSLLKIYRLNNSKRIKQRAIQSLSMNWQNGKAKSKFHQKAIGNKNTEI